VYTQARAGLVPSSVATHAEMQSARYHVTRLNPDLGVTPPALCEAGSSYTRQTLVDRSTGAVHSGLGCVHVAPGGGTSMHVSSFETIFYVLAGRPSLTLLGSTYRLRPNESGLIPLGVAHAWCNTEGVPASWIEISSPIPRSANEAPDDFVTGEPIPAGATIELDPRDPRAHPFFRLDEGQMDIDNHKAGAPVNAPTVSASMATALLAYSGIAVRMLIDHRQGASLSTLFMVEYQPGGVAQPHDHPFEECYVILDGEIEFLADGDQHTLRVGDVAWTGVGCVHSFRNTSGARVRWLETMTPQPPRQHAYRFERDWAYLAEIVDGGRPESDAIQIGAAE
jgi:quercetin dioxygenase-like cupin family protein